MAQYVKTPLSHTVAVDLTNQSYDGPQSPPQALKLPSPCDFLVYFFIYFMFPLSELLMETAQLVRTSMSPCGPGPSHDAEAAEVLLGLRARHEMTFFHFLSEATGPLELLESLAPGQVHVTGGWLRDRLLESQEVNERARLQWQRLQRLMATPRGDLDLIVSRPLADFYGALRDDEALRSVLQRPPLLVPKKGSRSATVSLRCKSRSAFEPGKPIGNPLETHWKPIMEVHLCSFQAHFILYLIVLDGFLQGHGLFQFRAPRKLLLPEAIRLRSLGPVLGLLGHHQPLRGLGRAREGQRQQRRHVQRHVPQGAEHGAVGSCRGLAAS